MPGELIEIQSREGPSFQAYLAMPAGRDKTAALVLASSVHGIDIDHQSMADEFASHGYIVLAPDLFWRTVPGALPRDDPRTPERARPRQEKIKTGEADMADALAHLRKLDRFDGRAVSIGFCYGGPYAILGPKRLGYAAGISCHGSQMGSFVAELEGVTAPVAIIWGDEDHAAPADVLDAYRAAARRMPNLEHQVLPGIKHGYMLRGNVKAFDQKAYDFSIERTLAIMQGLPVT